MTTGEIIHHAEVPRSDAGRAKFSHGLGLTRDESEVWVQGGFVFDVTVMPPKYKTKIDYWPGSHGWITFSLDGKYALPDNGVVYDVKTKKVVAELKDEKGKRFVGYRHIEVHFKDGKPYRMGDQIGKGGLDVPPKIEGWSPK